MLYNVCQRRPTMRDILRERTAELHDSLEQTPVMSCLFSEVLHRDQYQQHLAVLYGFVLPLEEALITATEGNSRAEPTVPVWPYQPRHAQLASDLRRLGVPPETLPVAHLQQLPPLTNPADALGAAYVLEGSRLGGRVIHKRLQDHFGASVPADYYAGAEEPARWPRFISVLNSIDTLQAQERISDSAVATFRCLSAWAANPEGLQ